MLSVVMVIVGVIAAAMSGTWRTAQGSPGKKEGRQRERQREDKVGKNS
jgi:hypothetical protein